jgi:putative ABC transport system permease protein
MLPINMSGSRLIAAVRTACSRAADLLLGRRRDRRLSDEIAAHLDELAETYVAQGMAPGEARLAARRAFGGVDQLTAAYRAQRGVPFIESLRQDGLFALRLLRKDRWSSAAGALALALGIAVSTTVFTLINGITLQELPVDDPDRVVHLMTESPRGRADTAYPDLADWQASARSFEGLAGYVNAPVTVGDGERAAEHLANAYVSWNALEILHERPIIGRAFTVDDDRPGASAVALLTHHVWTSRFAADPGVVGQIIRIDGAPVTIVGVMREGLRFPVETDLWQPLSACPRLNRRDRQLRNIGSFGRLADGTTIAQATAEMTAISSALAAEHSASNRDSRAVVMPFTERYSGRITETPPLMMLCAVGMIVLIASANAAMLLLAKAAPRAREVALRAALGATRARILRQLLIESLLLSAIAGGLGLVLAMITIRLLRDDLADLSLGLPYWMQFVFDWRVFTFVAAICLVTAIGSGLAPAWHLARTRGAALLKDGGRGIAGGTRTRRWSGALLVAELALTLTLLAGAGLLTRSADALADADRVVNAATVLTARLALPAAPFATVGERRAFFERLEEQLRRSPATQGAGLTTTLPFMGGPSRPVRLDAADAAAARGAAVVAISDGYLSALGLPMLRGRSFSPADSDGSAIVNQRFVEVFAGDRDVIGRQLLMGDSPADDRAVRPLTIVGVAPSFRQSPMRDALPVVFVPLRAQPGTGIVSMVVPRGDRPGVVAAVTEAVRAADADVAVFRLMPLQSLSELSRFNHRLMSAVLSAMATIAMLLSAVGLYGVTAFGVAQRTAEIGLRVALGAARGQLTWQLVRRTLFRIATGLALGLAGAIAIGQLLGGLLINTSPLDPLTFAAVIAVLCGVALTACLIPARRAMRLDPVAALRHE